MNSKPETSPSMITRSRKSGAWPTKRRLFPRICDQKNGVVVKGVNWSSMFLAATRPCCVATSQCSILTCVPVRRAGKLQTSPAANKVGTASDESSGPTTIAPFLSNVTPSMKRVFGRTPAPTTTASADSTSPSSSSTPLTLPSLPRNKRTCAEPNHSTPSFCRSRAKDAPTFLPRTRSKGTLSMATTATSTPRFLSDDATSIPMKEPPTTTIFWPFLASFAISAASSAVLRVKMPSKAEPGQKSFRGVPPAATRTLS
mmetsp:Transcript_35288/g.77091  ORF Transcript_35288/g.77091 Transcript_35288/m.77091 type:complete len:257 (-) Transcript_35288:1021-1791(-)